MYFKEKGNTNIDSEFNTKKKFSFKDMDKKTSLMTIGGLSLLVIGIIILIVIVVSAFSSLGKKEQYTLQLQGDERIVIKVGTDYIDPGYIAYDKKNNDVTSQVEVQNYVDTSIVGEYEVLYTIGNVTRVRYVVVETQIDRTYIYLHGDLYMYLEVGEEYKEPGFEVYDTIEQGLTEKVKVTGTIDTSKIGTYQIVYSVVNSRNKETTTKRNVIVVAKGQKPKK